MKKLIVAAAVVCTAVFAHAAAANWKASASGMYNGTGSTEDSALYSGAAYLFDAGVTSQAALFALIEAGTGIGTSTAGYVATATFDEGAFGGLTYSNGEQGGGAYTYYFVVVDGNNAYFSNEKTVTANTTATGKNVGFGSQSGSSTLPAAGFQGAGAWSSTAAIPEPTSGLLMLLGMAGLALRRRRA